MAKPDDRPEPKGRLRKAKTVTFYPVESLQLDEQDKKQIETDPQGWAKAFLESHGHKVNKVVGDPEALKRGLLEQYGGNPSAEFAGGYCGWFHEEWPFHSQWSWECVYGAQWLMA